MRAAFETRAEPKFHSRRATSAHRQRALSRRALSRRTLSRRALSCRTLTPRVVAVAE